MTGIKLKPDEDLRPSGKIAKAAAGGFGELVGWSPYFSPAGKAAGAIGSLLNLGSKAATRAIVGGLSGAAAAGARKTLTGAGDADSMAAAAAGGAVAAPVFGAMSGFDSLQECVEELTDEIFAVETGLSSDVSMNRRWSR